MNNPGGVVTVALDGENPLIFNPITGPADLYAIYQALSEYQGSWLITQTASEAVLTHKPVSTITNLPVNSWDLNLNYWNNGYPDKTQIWQNLSLAREYLVAYTVALDDNISPLVYLPFNTTPNSTSLIDTLWNYLYIAEGSDWTWQTGPPAYGPLWFKEQALLYTLTIISIIKHQFSMITLIGANVNKNKLKLEIYNGNNNTLHLILVVSYGKNKIALPVLLKYGMNKIKIDLENYNGNNTIEIYLYSPVLPSEVGAAIIPITNYGFLIAQYLLTTNKSNDPQNYIAYIIKTAIILISIIELIRRKR